MENLLLLDSHKILSPQRLPPLLIFNFHCYASLIHQLTYNRYNRNLYVAGYKEEGTITTSFDIRVQNEIDRFHIVIETLNRIDKYKDISKPLIDWCNQMLGMNKKYISEHGVDMPYIRDFKFENSNI